MSEEKTGGQLAFEEWSKRFDGLTVEDWDKDLADSERRDWEAIAAAGAASAHERTAELLGEVNELRARVAQLRNELAIDVSARVAVAAGRDDLREQLDDLRDRIDSLALGLETSAGTSHPSKKSEIERGCASALRGLLRIDGESGEETRRRLAARSDRLENLAAEWGRRAEVARNRSAQTAGHTAERYDECADVLEHCAAGLRRAASPEPAVAPYGTGHLAERTRRLAIPDGEG